MKELKIKFVDTCVQDIFIKLLSSRYKVITEGTPEFIFFSDENFGVSNKSYSREKYTKIFFTGENCRPINYDCDYAITFDHITAPWHFRLPSWAIVPKSYERYPLDHILKAHTLNIQKTKFCTFIHRNGGNVLRNSVFHHLNQYKKVDSVGPLFNNMGFTIGSDYIDKLEFIKDYKFVFAFENSSYPGYATEKIIDAFFVNSIPIYWGSETIEEDFNKDSFINANKFNTIQDLIDYIKVVDCDDQLYAEMTRQPKVKNLELLNYDKFLDWFDSTVYEKRRVKE